METDQTEKNRKQKYLMSEIIEAGFDAEEFADFVSAIREDGNHWDYLGCDLDVWTFDDLEKIVREFKASKGVVEEQTESNSDDNKSLKNTENLMFDFTGSGNGELVEIFANDQSSTLNANPHRDSSRFVSSNPTEKFLETKQQVLANKNQQMKNDLDDIFADLDALKVKKVSGLFNIQNKNTNQTSNISTIIPNQFSDFQINDKGEIVLLDINNNGYSSNTNNITPLNNTDPNEVKDIANQSEYSKEEIQNKPKKKQKSKEERIKETVNLPPEDEPELQNNKLTVEVVK